MHSPICSTGLSVLNINARARQAVSSPITEVATHAKRLVEQGVDLVDLTVGETNFDTPGFVQEAAIAAIRAGHTRYTEARGTLDLRRTIAEKLRTHNGLEYDEENVIVTVGAKHAIYEAMQVLISPGDQVLIPAPFWASYVEAARLAGGVPVVITTAEREDYKLEPSQLKRAMTPRTSLLVINSPNNPSGSVYTAGELAALAEVLRGTRIAVIADETYEALAYPPHSFCSFAAASEEAFARTVTINGLSKSHAMTGWRLGYAAGCREVIGAMARLQSHMTHNAPTFVQTAALAALAQPDNNALPDMYEELRQRSVAMVEGLNAMPFVRCKPVQGGLYCFPNVSACFGRRNGGNILVGSRMLAQRLLEEAQVAVVPGTAFGADANLRVSFGCSLDRLNEGMARIALWMRKLA